MVKRIIFDIDNTLIEWKNEYWECFETALKRKNINYTKDDIQKIINAIDSYESKYDYYIEEYMAECLKDATNLDIDKQYIDFCLEELSGCVPKEKDYKLIDTIEYLYNKYELVALTNWFKEEQEKRLEKIGLIKYFKKIYVPKDFKAKPNKEAFEVASEGNIQNCIMVGDNYRVDIKGAIDAGMKAIYLNKNSEENSKEYITIKNIEELKEIL